MILMIQCVAAAKAVKELSGQEQPYKLAYALCRLSNKLQEHINFYQEEELKLIKEYALLDEAGKIIMNDDQTFRLADATKANEFYRRREELGKMEAEIEGVPLQAPAPAQIRPELLLPLDGLIEFMEG